MLTLPDDNNPLPIDDNGQFKFKGEHYDAFALWKREYYLLLSSTLKMQYVKLGRAYLMNGKATRYYKYTTFRFMFACLYRGMSALSAVRYIVSVHPELRREDNEQVSIG